MPLIQQDMTNVPEWGETLPHGWYHVRVEKATVEESKNTPGTQTVKIEMHVQNEPNVGRVLIDFASLQSHALAKLKKYYNKIGYVPDASGHDPDRLIGAELWVLAEEDVYQGNKRNKIPPYGIRSLQEGAGQ